MNKRILSLHCHPDDTEFYCAGTLALLREKGWEIHSGTMTAGDGGTAEYTREEISKIRTREAAESIKILGGEYYCLWCEDVFVNYDKPTLLKAIELVRKVRPAIVFTPGQQDYMRDHVETSKVVQAACFAAGVPNVETPGVESFDYIPHLYYVDPPEAKDNYGREIVPGMWVDISSTMETKEKMLCCHESQRNWLLAHHGMDEYVLSMKRFAEDRGKQIGLEYAEGLIQHLGHAFPQDNILKTILGGVVHENKGE